MLLASVIILFLQAGSVLGWTYTEYLSTALTSYIFDTQVYSTTWTVIPTGSVLPTSSNIHTTQAMVNAGNGFNILLDDPLATIAITVTDLFLGPNASVCTVRYDILDNEPPGCTKTSFMYTTSTAVNLDDVMIFTDGDFISSSVLMKQATATGSGGEALFVTTNVLVPTSSDYPGIPPTTTTACDVYLKSDAVVGIQRLAEATYLDQCIDPRRYLCGDGTGTAALSGQCGTGWVEPFPPTGAARTNEVPGRGRLLGGKVLTVVMWSVLSASALGSVF
ncbi:hypothetical protein OIDMADRAFT_48572 [Oidiodendron maius Zn]|uniref:Uncharacterized protein n=1 Tax=Oidiodendron maius (strain Zn) TaxID=913774 RepID=A0A0C3HKI4_OIDMZ|nr:hypothetical protein OIDMADRAFT_48572 [Oidiodendron maius Zn]